MPRPIAPTAAPMYPKIDPTIAPTIMDSMALSRRLSAASGRWDPASLRVCGGGAPAGSGGSGAWRLAGAARAGPRGTTPAGQRSVLASTTHSCAARGCTRARRLILLSSGRSAPTAWMRCGFHFTLRRDAAFPIGSPRVTPGRNSSRSRADLSGISPADFSLAPGSDGATLTQRIATTPPELRDPRVVRTVSGLGPQSAHSRASAAGR